MFSFLRKRIIAPTLLLGQLIIISPPVLLPAPPSGGGGDPSDFEERLVNWTPGTHVGVVGGIPTNRTQCVTTECAAVTGAASGYKDGTLDAAALLQAAITSASANTYVLMPAGTWKILSGLGFAAGDSNVTLRGAGLTSTIIDCRIAAGTCIALGTGATLNYPVTNNDITAFTPSGDNTVLTVADSSEIGGTGTMVLVAVESDTTVPVMSVAGFNLSTGNPLRKQLTRVVSKTSTTVTVFPPIYGYAALSGLDAKLYTMPWNNTGYGIEDLTVDGNIPGGGTVFAGLGFLSVQNSWVKNAKIVRAQNYTIKLEDCLNIEIRDTEAGQLVSGGSNKAGLLINTVSASLFEDNIITEAFPNIEMNAGSSGNVIAYNFLHNENGSQTLNVNHGPHNAFNLLEGNVTTNTMSDGYFGGESETTYHRNLIHGNGINCMEAFGFCIGGQGTEADTPSWVIAIKRFGRNASVVGNVLGVADVHTFGVFSLGQPNIGNSYTGGTAQWSTADYWDDWNASGSTIVATLTTRTDACNGVMTLTAGTMSDWNGGAGPESQASILRPNDGSFTDYGAYLYGAQTGSTVPVTCLGGSLPALSTSMRVMPGNSGFQEEDLDVAATMIKMANWEADTETVVGDLGGYTMVDSLFRSSKPSWFNSLAWPPVDPDAPVFDYEIIPAGYRYMNAGSDPP
jgi:hypothetical protein